MKVKKEFSRFAASYNEHNVIQGKVADKIISMVEREPERIADLGCGAGALYSRIKWSLGNFYAIDFSPSMLELHPKSSSIEVVESDFNDLSIYKRLRELEVDLLLSASALQWSSNIQEVFKAIDSLNVPFVIALFTSSTFKTVQQAGATKSPIHSKETIEKAAREHLKGAEIEIVKYELEFKKREDIFRYIKRSGVSGGEKQLSYKQTRRLIREYPLNYLEFEVVFLKRD